MIRYDLVPFHEIAEFVAKNVTQHYADLKENTGHSFAKIDWQYYLDLSRAGHCLAVVAYDGEQAVGYSWYTISNDPLHMDKWMASSDAFWVDKAYRSQVNLFREAKEALKKIGVHEVSYLVGSPAMGRLLARQGYKKTHELWSVDL